MGRSREKEESKPDSKLEPKHSRRQTLMDWVSSPGKKKQNGRAKSTVPPTSIPPKASTPSRDPKDPYNSKNSNDEMLRKIIEESRIPLEARALLQDLQMPPSISKYKMEDDDEVLRDALVQKLPLPIVFYALTTHEKFRIEAAAPLAQQIMVELSEKIALGEFKTAKEGVDWYVQTVSKVYELIYKEYDVFMEEKYDPLLIKKKSLFKEKPKHALWERIDKVQEERCNLSKSSAGIPDLQASLKKDGFGDLCEDISDLFAAAHKRLTTGSEKLAPHTKSDFDDYFGSDDESQLYVPAWWAADWQIKIDCTQISSNQKRIGKLENYLAKVNEALSQGNFDEANYYKGLFLQKVEKYLTKSILHKRKNQVLKEKIFKQVNDFFNEKPNKIIRKHQLREKEAAEVKQKPVRRSSALSPIQLLDATLTKSTFEFTPKGKPETDPIRKPFSLLDDYFEQKRRLSYDQNGDLKEVAEGTTVIPQDGSNHKKNPSLSIETTAWHLVPDILLLRDPGEKQDASEVPGLESQQAEAPLSAPPAVGQVTLPSFLPPPLMAFQSERVLEGASVAQSPASSTTTLSSLLSPRSSLSSPLTAMTSADFVPYMTPPSVSVSALSVFSISTSSVLPSPGISPSTGDTLSSLEISPFSVTLGRARTD